MAFCQINAIMCMVLGLSIKLKRFLCNKSKRFYIYKQIIIPVQALQDYFGTKDRMRWDGMRWNVE
ncbi:hypothetical protein F511_24667 [Dorcoceras hygrometricum]|uniref:Uncharacterized protein n=1 Tax=Dorcoceras hygrometricum TaxID=472368 RepID=A0A2Z7D8F8_9LAMI|nr:hypothetical protein F511_24667 [Dorcoceras hygrometricum]